MVLIWDVRAAEVVASSDALRADQAIQKWLGGADKEERKDRERAARRRPKLVKILDDAIRAMGTLKAEPEEMRDLLLRLALLTQASINKRRDDALLAEIEPKGEDDAANLES